jgi:hypothetical protein
VRELADGGTWNTTAGQPTDDSEMALALARMLVEKEKYDAGEARKAYVFWLESGPFDCGMTVAGGLRGCPNPDSHKNGTGPKSSAPDQSDRCQDAKACPMLKRSGLTKTPPRVVD